MVYILGILIIIIASVAVLYFIHFKKNMMYYVFFGFIVGMLMYSLLSAPYRIERIMSEISVLFG